MIPIGLDGNTDEDCEHDLGDAPGSHDKYRRSINNPHHVNVPEDIVELEQECHLQRCHSDIVDNHVRVSNLSAQLGKLQIQEEPGEIPSRQRYPRSSPAY